MSNVPLHHYIIDAELTQDVDYKKNGKAKIIPKGTRVKVDIAKALGFDGVDHFDLYRDEYKPVYDN